MDSTDTPLATVPFGKSEILTVLMTIASFCNATFGKDYGISQNAQAISALGVVLLPIGLGLFRSIKHHGAMHANAIVIAKQIEQGVAAVDPAAAPSVELPQPPAVGTDLPVEAVSTSLPAAGPTPLAQ